MNKKLIKVDKLKPNNENPRNITKEKLDKLVKSIEEFPKMLELRPIVVNKDYLVLGGNMRLNACKRLEIDKVWVIVADNLTEEQEKEFIIKDNVNAGEWDWNILANEWNAEVLNDWGMAVWVPNHEEEFEPSTNPFTSTEQVTEDDVENTSNEFGSELRKGRERVFQDCKCPKCQEKFKVEV